MGEEHWYNTSCSQCGKEFERSIFLSPEYRKRYKTGITGNEFCSVDCTNKFRTETKRIITQCTWCNKNVITYPGEIRKSKSGNSFCDHSCAASYNNTKKRKSRRSKMEMALYDLLCEEFPNFKILANDKLLLDGYEVDISFPEIKLAIEWNGIVHFKPIYGEQKLNKIQARDAEKQRIAELKGVFLIVIPDLVSNKKYLREAFLNIKKIIREMTEYR